MICRVYHRAAPLHAAALYKYKYRELISLSLNEDIFINMCDPSDPAHDPGHGYVKFKKESRNIFIPDEVVLVFIMVYSLIYLPGPSLFFSSI